MGQPPLTYLERKWASMVGSNNLLINSATQTSDRKNVPLLDYDVYRNISTFGRRTLMSLGRYVYENSRPLAGSISEMARFASAVFTPQFTGKNSEWGRLAESVLAEEDQFIDIRRGNFTMDTFRELLVLSIIRDGELGVILADVKGEPKLQCIPSHRIGSRTIGSIIDIRDSVSPYDGAKLIDGVIVDDYGAALAYRVYDEAGITYRDVSANDMMLVFLPDYVEQLRGVSIIGKAAFDAWDVQEGRNFELIAQKIRATMPVSVKNETGFIDSSKAVFGAKATANSATTNNAEALPTQVMQPGQVMYFKAGTGQGIEFPENNNPGPNVMAFQDEMLRSILHSIGWSFDFSHNPSKVGGAQMRIVVEKVNSSIARIQRLALRPSCRRIYGWRVAKHVKNGRLPEETEWFKWGFQGDAEITADEKYSSDVTIQEIRAGIRAPQQGCERFGAFWEDVQDQSIAYRKRLNERCKAEGVDPKDIVWPSPNGNPEQPQQAQNNQEAQQ